ncbi:MAG: 1-acyl-sn-glycerol-3-phosphate acyltransferase [Cyclobacteriaceae bacterium]
MKSIKKYIDVEQAIRDKNKNLARWMPGFILNYIKRIVHEDDLNGGMARVGHFEGLDFVNASLNFFNARVEAHGIENIPQTGGCILASNHPLGGLDGMAFMKAVSQTRTDMKFLVNDILMNIKNLHAVFLPVNKHGTNPRKGLQLIDEAYASDEATLIFPAGLVSRKIDGQIQDLQWHKSFIGKAIQHKKDIIPVYIDGKNSSFFYNLSRLRSRLGIKANIEMFYLADEMFKQSGKTIKVFFGKPIPYTHFDKSKNQKEWAETVRKKAYQLYK